MYSINAEESKSDFQPSHIGELPGNLSIFNLGFNFVISNFDLKFEYFINFLPELDI